MRDDDDEHEMGHTRTIRASNGYDSIDAKLKSGTYLLIRGA